jgi:hypothetical protein
MGGLLAQADSL